MTARSNHPTDKVRELQRKLFIAAKRSPKRRFHALFDRIWRGDVLLEAWRRVRANKGAAGIDEVTLEEIERIGVEEFLRDLQERLKSRRYRPQPVKRRYISKPDGRKRPLGIPTIRDRVAQMAAKLVLEPLFEADFKESSFGYRPKRSATDALERIRITGGRGNDFVVDGDIKGFFDGIDQEILMKLVARRVSNRRVLKLVRQWLRAGVMEEGEVRSTLAGTPQGGVISPLLANIYLDVLDTIWQERCRDLTNRRHRAGVKDLRDVIRELNPVLRGWGNYFRTGNASRQFNTIDGYVRSRLLRLKMRRGGDRRKPVRPKDWPHLRFLNELGLHKLLGTIRYPGGVHAA